MILKCIVFDNITRILVLQGLFWATCWFTN